MSQVEGYQQLPSIYLLAVAKQLFQHHDSAIHRHEYWLVGSCVPKCTLATMEYNLPHQEEFYTGATGTDAWAIQVTQSGVATGLISIPLRYMHTSVEVIDINDIKNAGKILANYIVSLNSVDLEEMLCY